MRKKRPPVPDLHFVMILVAMATLILSMLLYFFAPTGKAEAFVTMMSLVAGFLFGKFTNGFKTGDKEENPDDTSG